MTFFTPAETELRLQQFEETKDASAVKKRGKAWQTTVGQLTVSSPNVYHRNIIPAEGCGADVYCFNVANRSAWYLGYAEHD